MATPPSLVQMAFAAGLDESQQPEVQDPSSGFPVLQNVRQSRVGALEKRLGFGSLTRSRLSGSRSSGARLFAHGGVPTVIDGSTIDSYSASADVNVTRGSVPACTYSVVTVPSPSDPLVLDVEHCNGFIAVSVGDGFYGYGQIEIVDSSGAVVRSLEKVGAGSFPNQSLTSFGSRYFVAFVYDSSGTGIVAYILDTQALASGWTSLATVAATSSTVLPAVCSLSDRVAIAYVTTSGTNRLAVKTYDASGLVQSTTVNTSSTTPDHCDISGSIAGGTLWVTWNEGAACKACGLNPTSITSVAATTVTTLTMSASPTRLVICEGSFTGTARTLAQDDTGGSRLLMIDVANAGGIGVTTGSPTSVYGLTPVSRPFQVADRYYMAFREGPFLLDDPEQGIYVVADWTGVTPFVTPVANIAPGLVPNALFYAKFSPVGTTGQYVHAFAMSTAGLVSAAAVIFGSAAASVQLLTLDFAVRQRWQPAAHGGSTFLGGAVLSVYDGDRVTEAGFMLRPAVPTTSLGGTGTSPTIGYRYVAVWEDVDATGNVVTSGISDPTDVVQPVNQTVTLSVPSLTLSARLKHLVGTYASSVYVAWYRTIDRGEPPYYRLGRTRVNPSNATVTFADNIDDDVLKTGPQLYSPSLPSTPGAALDRRAPPGLTSITSYNGMLVGACGATIYYSGQQVYGEATWFSPVFQLPLPDGGDITALAAQDGTLFAWTRTSIWAVSGDAPSDNGAVGGLGTPRKLASDVGCIEPSSVVVTSLGIFFRSDRGIEILTRSGEVSPIGRPVQQTLAAFPVVSSAVLDDRHGLVRFSLAESESGGVVSGDGCMVVYDLRLGQWQSVDRVTGSVANQAVQSATMLTVGGTSRYAWLATDGTVYAERDATDASAYFDGSSWITMAAETASFKQGGIQGQQQVNSAMVLARKTTDFDLSMALSYNYETSFRAATTWTNPTITGLLSGGWPITQLRHAPHDDAACQGVRLRLSDATPTSGTVGNGKGATWIALTLDITPRPGVFDVPDGAT